MKSIKALSQLLGMLRTAKSNMKRMDPNPFYRVREAKGKEVIKSKVDGETKTKRKRIET